MVQLEDGYLKIANELFEQIIKYPFTKNELKIVLAVMRKTYGFNKKSDLISLSQLADMTGLDKSNISRTVVNLTTLNIFNVSRDKYIQLIELNKYYMQWVVKSTTVVKTTTKGCQNNNSTVVKTTTTKDTSTKDILKTVTVEKISPSKISKTWTPNETNQAWLNDSGLSEFEQQKVIRDFRDFWLLGTKRMANWDKAFRRNPVVNSVVTRKLNQSQYEPQTDEYGMRR